MLNVVGMLSCRKWFLERSKMAIKYLTGDATDPKEVEGPKLLIHVSNNQGAWGAGFVLAISKRWSEPESVYRRVAKSDGLELGEIQIIQVEKDIVVVNMIAQTLGWTQGPGGKMTPPINYDALAACLWQVGDLALCSYNSASVVAPRFGSGLAGGKWETIETIINDVLSADIPTYIYDLPTENKDVNN
jgi:O-acetyl-ADP-ribose deacetylase (regulator of RNase III)